MQGAQGGGTHAGHKPGDHQPAGGPGGQGRAELGGGHARALDEKAGDQDDEQQAEHQGVVADVGQAGGTHQVAAHGQAQEHGDSNQPGEIENDGEEQIEVALEEGDAEQGMEQVGLNEDQGGADGQKHEAPEEEAVGGAGAGDAQHLGLAEGGGHKRLDPVAQVIEARQRLPLAVDAGCAARSPSRPDAKAARASRYMGTKVACPVTDVPVNLP